jgi:hypothetical protein
MTTEEQISIENQISMTLERQDQLDVQLARFEAAWGIKPNETQDTDNLGDHTG